MASNEEINIIIRAKDRASSILKGVTGLVTGLGKVGLLALGAGFVAVGAGIAVSVSRAAEFESSMSRVGALSGATEAQLLSLTEKAKVLGQTTAFTAREAAEGMQFLAMAGFETNDVLSAMPGLLSLAAAGQTDLAQTSDIASNILTGFGIEASKMGMVADVLAKTFTSANVDLSMLGQTMSYVAPIASQMGFSLEEVSAAAGLLGNAGIQGSMAGTTLRSALLSLAAPSGQAKKLLQDLGIAVQDQQGNMLSLDAILGNVNTAFRGMTEAQKAGAAASLVGKRAVSGFMVLLDQSASGALPAFTKELESAGGTADRIAAEQLDNLKGSMTLLRSAIDGVAIGIGSALTPHLKTLADSLIPIINEYGPKVIEIFEAFATNLSTTAGPAIDIINESLSRMNIAFGGSGEPVNLLDVGLAALKGTLDGVITGVQLFASAMEKIAEAVETVANLTDQVKTIADLASDLSGSQLIAGLLGGVGLGSAQQAGLEDTLESGAALTSQASTIAQADAASRNTGFAAFERQFAPFAQTPAPQVAGGQTGLQAMENNFMITITLDGKQVAESVSVRQGAQANALNDIGGRANR